MTLQDIALLRSKADYYPWRAINHDPNYSLWEEDLFHDFAKDF